MKIAILDDYLDCARQFAPFHLLETEHQLTVFTRKLADEDLPTLLSEFEVLLVMRERTAFPAALISQLTKLKLIITTGRRNDVIDMDACKAAGITVCGTDSPPHSTAELTFALIMAAAKGIVSEHNDMQRGGWQSRVSGDLKGSTLGIIGLGRIGGIVAAYAQAFGMHVVAWSQNLTAERAREVGVEHVSRDELMTRSDFITIHLRLSDRTRNLVGAKELALLKEGSWIVNTSRAQIINMDALLNEVRAGRLNAALDVFELEPLPIDSELRSLPNLLLSPHKGYVARSTYKVFYEQTYRTLLAWLDGKPVNVIV
jgi:phosphoglycerate dehydrogenase-like enzyme